MNGIIKQLERLTEEQLYTISAALDDHLDRLANRRIKEDTREVRLYVIWFAAGDVRRINFARRHKRSNPT